MAMTRIHNYCINERVDNNNTTDNSNRNNNNDEEEQRISAWISTIRRNNNNNNNWEFNASIAHFRTDRATWTVTSKAQCRKKPNKKEHQQ
jgi:hypothetical protein